MNASWVVAVVSTTALVLASAACSAKFRSSQAFAGTLTSPTATCPSTQANLLLRDGKVVFSPAETTWVLSGYVVENRVKATRSRPGIDHTTYMTMLDATVTDASVTGTYTTPTCTYAVQLARY